MKKKTKRSIISIVLLISCLILSVSGIIMELTHRETANAFYMGAHRLHNIAAVIFVVTTTYHLVFNWRALTSYFHASK